MRIIGHAEIEGEASGAFKNYEEYPLDPKVGTWAYIHGSLMLCSEVEDVPLWIPVTQERNTLVHDQSIESARWLIPHMLGSTTIMVQCFDLAGNVMLPSEIRNIDEDSTEVIFPNGTTGKAILMYGMESGISARGKINVVESIPVQGVHFTLSDLNPYDDLGYGEWKLITGDAVLSFCDGSKCGGNVEGSNSKAVPLPAHTHRYSRITQFQSGTTNVTWTSISVPKVGWSAYNGVGNSSGTRVSMRLNNAEDTSSSAGSANAKIDVKGAVIKLNVWVRTE